jgi:D-serine dehydratase
MSRDAKEWKKELLREHGVNVIEYASDYSAAVKEGREKAEQEANNYFVDDENSKNLFLGYAVAALRLKNQLEVMNIKINQKNPLNVFIPCGVGGAPGGIAYGLKQVYQDAVNIYFGEPTHSPCMLLSLVTGLGADIAVGDLGIDNQTIADGLAVGRASALVSGLMEHLVDGCFTVDDQMFYQMLKYPYEEREFKLEPSATAGLVGYLRLNQLQQVKERSNNIVWATGGRLVPEAIFRSDLKKGEV